MDENSNLGKKIFDFNNETEETMTDVAVKISELLNNSTTANIVPTTAATVTKPLKIDASVGALKKELPRGISPMVDGRVLSATSVSQAINKMNDTVLDTKTLIRESGLSKLSPAASAIISMSRENNFQSPNKNKIQDIEQIEIKHVDDRKDSSIFTTEKNDKSVTTNTNTYKINNGNLDANNFTKGQNSDKNSVGNHVTSTGLMDSKTLEVHVQNNIGKLINTEKVLVQKSESEKLRESRTVFAPEIKPVQPIQILVKEKPSDQDVESGNVRLPVSATNGSFHGRPR
ncbi:hypothetical protein WA026_012961 [Henosepilachna vigintioctopunctata]|uniref:Uncharacterized protein n=1 Tax=Henosepilachna vigintioctopunctata TaxID=420089 RepID=A0AAW1TUS8_9CUCU